MSFSKLFLRLAVLAALLAPSGAWAAACSGTAFAHPTGGTSPWLWTGATTWATTSGGATACTLATGNAVVFDANSTTGTYTTSAFSLASIATSGATAGITVSGSANLTISAGGVDVSGVTYANTGTLSFTNTSGTNNIKTAGQTLGSVVINGTGATFELLDTTVAGAVTLTAGTLDASTNNPNVTIANISGAGNITCGTGTWTINSPSVTALWNPTGTISCASAALTFSPNGPVTGDETFTTLGATYGVVTVNTFNNTAYGNYFSITLSSNTATFTTLNINGPRYALLTVNQTLTLTNLNVTGTSSGLVNLQFGANTGTATTITCTNAPTITWAQITGITFTNATTAKNSYNGGSNTNLTVTGPSGGGRIIGG